MLIESGDLWVKHQDGHHIVIPINQERKNNGLAVMGSGLAHEAAVQFPQLPFWLGEQLRQVHWHGSRCYWHEDYRLIMFPTKAKWREPSTLSLIKASCSGLLKIVGSLEWNQRTTGLVYMPKLGCGCGRLNWNEVRPALERELPGPNFIALV